jgi:Na+-transporting NADH:ubiquinone oxidoreductase subunit F
MNFIILTTLSFVIIGIFLSLLIIFFKKRFGLTNFVNLNINGTENAVQGGSNLLNVLKNQDILISNACGGKGMCRLCGVKIIKNPPEITENDKATFSKKKLDEGWRLSCLCKVKRDMNIELPNDVTNAKKIKTKVKSTKFISPFIKEITLSFDEEIIFFPGSYFNVNIKPTIIDYRDIEKTIPDIYLKDWIALINFQKKIKIDEFILRAYSVADFSSSEKLVKFYVKLSLPPIIKNKKIKKPIGMGSSYLFNIKENENLYLCGPYGKKDILNIDTNYVFLIGGVGVSFARTCIMSLLNDLKTKKQIVLWHGARSLTEAVCKEEFETLENKYSNFKYNLVLSDPTKEDVLKKWPVSDKSKTNYLCNAFASKIELLNDLDDFKFLICGPPKHNVATIKLLDEYDVDEENMIIEESGV